MLSFNQLACRRDGKLLFEQGNLVVHRGQKVGVTGANGTGKSSLFAMILGQLDADAGRIELQAGVSISHVAQETPALARPAIEHVIDGDVPLRELEARMAVFDNEACDSIESGTAHAMVLADFEQAGGYTARARAGALLNGLGFAEPEHALPVAHFSGGWRMRLNLAQALMRRAELLLLDEPTNHLDLDAVLWLETWLRQHDGTLLLISHDREFLDRITSHTLQVARHGLTLYTGNYSAFERISAEKLMQQQAQFERQQVQRAHMQSFVDRFRAKATKARQAQSRLKMLEKLTLAAPLQAQAGIDFAFAPPDALPDPLVVLRKADIGYKGQPVLEQLTLSIARGDRIGLLGANGAGKSTFVKALVGELALLHGERLPAQRLRIGYFAQHQIDRLDGCMTAVQAVQAADPALGEAQSRNLLGGFGFSGDMALQRVGTLSGGERARLALAIIVHQRPNMLLLDEPTNHLDMAMRQGLADALQGFDGALVVISHDRTLLGSVVDNLWLVAHRTVKPFDDDLDGYARWLARQRAGATGTQGTGSQATAGRHVGATGSPEPAATTRAIPAGNSTRGIQSDGGSLPVNAVDTDKNANTAEERRQRKREAAEARARLQPLKKAAVQSERLLENTTGRLQAIRAELADESVYTPDNKSRLAALLADESNCKQAVEQAEEQWLQAMEALEAAAQPTPAAGAGEVSG